MLADLERIQKQLDELLAFKRYAEPLLRRYEEVCGGPQPNTEAYDSILDTSDGLEWPAAVATRNKAFLR